MRNFSGNNRSERGKDFSKRGSRDSGRPSMHQATCSNCGKDCEVPFKPTSGKPIFCSNCFDKSQNDGPKKYGKERSDRKFKSDDSRKRSFDYSNSSADNKGKENDQLKKEIGILNKKVDKILEILSEVLSTNNHSNEFEEEIEEPKLEKKIKKKVTIKKK
ncbi:MAG: hypothetical protein H6613_09185 [Ignavibacteriales bacterium]|nr:hypothetical protein [Ignavibacteriales bacterium]